MNKGVEIRKVAGVAAGVLLAVEIDGWTQETNASQPAARSLEEIVVTASRRETPLRDTPEVIQVIDRRAIEAMKPMKTGALLEYIAGTSVETGTGVGMPDRTVVGANGLPAGYTLVLVDGVRLLSEHIHTGQNLENIPPQAIERIEVMRGAASAHYGTGPIGGLVNIVTRRYKDAPEVTLEAAAGSYETYEGGLTILAPVGAVRLASFSRWEQSEGIPLTLPTHRAGHSGYSRLSLLNRADVRLGQGTDLVASLHYLRNTMDFNRGSSAEPKWGTAEMSLLSPVLAFAQALSPTADAHVQVAHAHWDNEASVEKNLFWEPQAYMAWRPFDEQRILVGGDYRWNEFERAKVALRDQTGYGIFAQHEWRPSSVVGTLAALRYDEVLDVASAWSPKVALLYVPVDTVRIRASIGRNFHAPTVQELYEEGFGHGGRARRFGNPNLEPEYSTTYTLGLEWSPAPSADIRAHGFYSKVDDMIVPVYEGPWEKDPGVDVWRRQNIEEAEVYGGEAELRVWLGQRAWLDAGYTHSLSEKKTGRPLPYRPGYSFFGRLTTSQPIGNSLTLGGFIAVRACCDREAWNWRPAAGTPPDNPDGLTIPLTDYTKLDAGVTLGIGKSYELFARVENILGEDIQNLDDALTVIDGEPVVQVGLRYSPLVE